jgi:hypothetical protein
LQRGKQDRGCGKKDCECGEKDIGCVKKDTQCGKKESECEKKRFNRREWFFKCGESTRKYEGRYWLHSFILT